MHSHLVCSLAASSACVVRPCSSLMDSGLSALAAAAAAAAAEAGASVISASMPAVGEMERSDCPTGEEEIGSTEVRRGCTAVHTVSTDERTAHAWFVCRSSVSARSLRTCFAVVQWLHRAVFSHACAPVECLPAELTGHVQVCIRQPVCDCTVVALVHSSSLQTDASCSRVGQRGGENRTTAQR